MRRVVITGIGLVTPLGTGKDKAWKNLLAGECGIDKITQFDSSEHPVHIAAEVKDFVPENYIEKMRKAGHEIVEVSLPMSKYSLAIYYIVVPAEVSSNLARYDGIRYGLRSKEAKNLSEIFGKSRDEGFEAENKRRIMIGSYVLSSGFYDAYYLQAQKARTILINEFDKLFEDVDFLVGPVAPTPAFKIGENVHDPIKMYLADILNVPASLAGLPAISIPAGKTEAGLPVGVQIIGKMESDSNILALADSLEEK